MTVDEPQLVAITIKTTPIVSNIGYLKQQSTFVNCPACEKSTWSIVQLEPVTCLQRLLSFTKLCKSWKDINHYCSSCGCFIGRFVPVGCSERCLSSSARRQAAVDEMRLKTRPKDCAVTAQKARENVLAKRAQQQAEKEAKQSQVVTTTVVQVAAPPAKAQ